MTIPNDVKASIDKHLQAVREHLGDKEETVQNEILEGLRDHITEALTRAAEPVTMARIESILADMDDPSSYAEEPAVTDAFAPKRRNRLTRNIWAYLAGAFLVINCIGVWKLIEIEKKTGGGNAAGDAGKIARAIPGNPPSAMAGETAFHCAAFMENKEPVLNKANESLTWLFSENVVPQDQVGKKLAKPPLKMLPNMPGDYHWKSARVLVFTPKEEWRPNKSFKVTPDSEFITCDGARYRGAPEWRFRTIDYSLQKVSLDTNDGQFCFDLGFSLVPDRKSLGERLKLSYVNADGESIPLDYTMVQQGPSRSALVRTRIVPAISFIVRVAPGLAATDWKAGTEQALEKKVQNPLMFSLNTAIVDERDATNPSIVLAFSRETNATTAAAHIAVSPSIPLQVTRVPQDSRNLIVSGKFAPGISYEVKVRRGLVSVNGFVMSYDATRTVVFSNPRQNVPKPAIAGNNFDLRHFSKEGAGIIAVGKEELTWEFNADVAGAKEIGVDLPDAPVEFTPKAEGKFRWKSARELAFTPATEWELNQFYSARMVRDLKSPSGARYVGGRFWAFSTPSFALASVVQTGNPGGNRFLLCFTGEPEIESLRKTLKVYSLLENGQRVFTDCVVTPDTNPRMMIASLAAPTTGTVYFEIAPGLRRIGWEKGTTNPMMKETNRSSVLSVREIRDNGANAGVLGIHVTFSEEVNVKDVAAFIEITPNVKFSVQKVSGPNNQLFLSGGFKAETRYEVKIRPGLVSKDGDVLANESKTTVSFPRLRASLSFDADGRYLSPEGTMLIPLKSVNLKECRISVAPVLVNNLVAFARDDHEHRSYGIQDGESSERAGYDYEDYEGGYGRRTNIEDMIGNVTGKDIKLSASSNTEATTYLNLREFTHQKGAYVVQAKSRDKDEARSYDQVRSDSHLVVVTDLGVTAKTSANSVFMWVCSLKNAKPAAGVEVTAFSRNNQVIAKAITNADGVASLDCDIRDKNKTPFLVTAQLGEDLSYLRLDGNALDADQTESVRDYRTGGCEAFLFTDRGIFRPGETLHAKTIIRNNDFTVPASFPVVFQIVKPDGHLYKEIPATPNSFGIAEIEAVMPDFLPTGRYSLNLRIPRATENLGKTGFLLEDFVPPQIRVKANVEDERVEAGDPIVADILAEHLFGSPAAGLKANVKCILSVTAFSHKNWSEFIFGEQNQRDYYAGDKPTFTLKPIDVENLVLNGEGKVTASIETGCCLKAPGPVHALIQATVFEPGGRSVTASANTTIDPYPFYIGLKRSGESYVHTGDKQKFQVITVLPNGEARTEGKPLLVKVAQVNWNYTYKRASDGTYGYRSFKEEIPIKEDTLAFSATPSDYVYVPQTSGYHQITFTDPDTGSTASVSFYACDWGQSWTNSQKERPDSLTLKLDKAEYSANDKAKLTIQAPFAGTALLTIESDRVLESRYVVFEKNTAEIDLDIKASFAPNVHCTVSVIRPAVAESAWTGHRAFGSIPLRISPANHRLNVALEVPATILPQSTLKAKVLLKDDAGHPADGEVTVVAVDEAICMLTSFKTPSPLAWLYEIRRLGVASHDVYSELMRVLDESVLSGDSHISGDGDGDGNADAAELLTRRLNPIKANRFKPVSLWVSQVMVKDGVAEVDVNVPEFTGELRIMAIACNAQRMGSAQGTVKVKRPLIVQPSLPRFLAPGDECEMSVNIFNEIGKDITAKLSVTCGGPLSTTRTEQNVDIKQGASVLVFVPIVAGNVPGKALCTVTCEADSVRFSDTTEIAVRPPVAAEVISDSGILAVGKSVEVPIPENLLPETLLRNITISADPTIELGAGLQYLLRYPYGCLEQTTSSAFPLLYLSDLANRSLEHSMTQDEVRTYVTGGIWRLLSMQQPSGGFSYWPHSWEPDLWTSVYATHFLVEAKKAGYDVPEDCLKRALGAVRANLEMNRPDTMLSANELQLRYDTRAYACYVLAMAGDPDYAWQERMLEMKDKISYYARLLNASALLVEGEPKRAVPLIKELGLPGEGIREMGGAFNSSNRNAALLLSAWLDIDPKNENVLKLVQILSKSKRNGYWGSTQENAMVMLALGKYVQRTPKTPADFKGVITLPNGTSETFDHKKDRSWTTAVGEKGKITITNNGPGTFLFSLRAEGIPGNPAEYHKQPQGRNEGLFVRRVWLNDKGDPLDLTQVKQNALVVAEITLNPNGNPYDNIAIEDLLPAGLEIENPDLETSQSLPWAAKNFAWCFHRDIRDDRLLLFTRPVSGRSVFYYVARAVTPGKFIVPPITAECMYKPELRSVNDQDTMIITK